MMPQLLRKEERDEIDYGNESDNERIYMEMLEEIRDSSKSHPNVNSIEACYKICNRIKQRQLERKGASKSTQNMGKYLHKVFKTVAKIFRKIYHPWVNLVYTFPISLQNPETFLKLPNCQTK